MTDTVTPLVREAVAVFQTEKDMQAAIDELLTHGFNRAELSLLASTKAVETVLSTEPGLRRAVLALALSEERDLAVPSRLVALISGDQA